MEDFAWQPAGRSATISITADVSRWSRRVCPSCPNCMPTRIGRMRSIVLLACAGLYGALLVAGSAATAVAGELLPAETPVEQAIDHYIEVRLQTEGVSPAPQADDATLLRRTL